MLNSIDSVKGGYILFINSLPGQYVSLINLFIFTLLIVIYTVFVWKFYRFLAQKDIIRLDLNRYNKSKNPALKKLLAAFLYFVEYIVILPFAVFFWFAILTIFLILLSKEQSVEAILLISAAVVTSVRITSYYSKDLSRDLAKMFPFTILVIFLLTPNFFSLNLVMAQLSKLSLLFNDILYYLLFIIGVEIIFRFLELIFSIRKSNHIEEQIKIKKR